MKKETKSKSHFSFLISHFSSGGFTLVELLIVIAVIGVLAVSLIMVIDPFTQIQKANDAKRKSDLAQIQRALQIYYQDNNSYPPSTPNYEIYDQPTTTTIPWGGSWPAYMSKVPADPSSSKNYVYYSTGQAYYLYASLDRGGPNQDPDLCYPATGFKCSNVPAGASCGAGVVCNFGVSSPNASP